MRELMSDDGYLISEIIDKTDVKIPTTTKIVKVKGKETTVEKTEEEFGLELIIALVRKIYKAKDETDQLIANVLEKDIKYVKSMKLKDKIKVVKEIFGKEGFFDFFKQWSTMDMLRFLTFCWLDTQI